MSIEQREFVENDIDGVITFSTDLQNILEYIEGKTSSKMDSHKQLQYKYDFATVQVAMGEKQTALNLFTEIAENVNSEDASLAQQWICWLQRQLELENGQISLHSFINNLSNCNATIANRLGKINRDVEGSRMEVFPNPAQNHVYIKLLLQQSSTIAIKIVSLMGETVYEQKGNQTYNMGQHLLSIDIPSIPSDIYFLQVITKEGIQTQKLILNY